MCEIVILESKRSRRYYQTPFDESPLPQKIMTLKIVPAHKEEEKKADGPPIVQVPAIQQPAAAAPPVVNAPAAKSSVVQSAPIRLPVVSRPVAKSPAVFPSPPPSSSNGGGQSLAKNGKKKEEPTATKSKRSPASEPSPPEIIRRVNVTPVPNKARVPKVVRFALDETRNTAMKKIDAKEEDKRPYAQSPTSSSDDSSDDSFTDPPSPVSPTTFQSYFDRKTPSPSFLETQPARRSVRFSPHAKDDRSFSSMERNAFQAGDNMSRNNSGNMVPAGPPGSPYQTANPTSETFQHSKAAPDLTSPVRQRSDSVTSSEPKYLPDPDSDSDWNVDSDLESYIDPGECVVNSDADDDWNSESYGSSRSRKPLEPIFMYRPTNKASVSSPKPSTSSSGKPLEPVFMHRSKSKASASPARSSSSPPQKPLEPVFVYRTKGQSSKEPVFVWRPSSDVKKETKFTHGGNPDGLPASTYTTKNVAASPLLQPKQQQLATDGTDTNTGSRGAARDHHSKKDRHSAKTSKSTRRSSRNLNANPPSVIHEEDEGEGPVAHFDKDLGVSWRDI